LINDKTAPKLLEHDTKLIVEAANIPTSPSADSYLYENGILIVPDFIANAGDVIGSFVEYKGETEKDAFDLIAYKVSRNVKSVLAKCIMEEGENEGKTPRTVAMDIATQRVHRAMLLRRNIIEKPNEMYMIC
jgi:glutamate dehydrogenase (NAD(P)+)